MLPHLSPATHAECVKPVLSFPWRPAEGECFALQAVVEVIFKSLALGFQKTRLLSLY